MIGFPQPYMYYCNARIAMRCSQQYQQRQLEHGYITCSENSEAPAQGSWLEEVTEVNLRI